ncbi:MAG TPA: MCE family protein [Amycolatopsis sp.]|nr:MCE family protein [Amycolatopsis sp.]
MRSPANLVKVLALVVTTGLLSALLVAVFGNVRFQDEDTYRALFADVSGMHGGEDVRAAGVPIGQVKDLAAQQDHTIEVTFTVRRGITLTTGSQAVIRYKNLVGDRYLELTAGSGGPLAPGGTIPLRQTAPALDLDELYNGFAPLFEALQPDQVNQLSSSLISVLQGESGAVDDLLANLGPLTSQLADRDHVIGQLIDNLNQVLGTVNARTPQLSDLITQVQQLVSGLAADRDPIGQSFGKISDVSRTVANLVGDARPQVTGTITQLDRLAALLNGGRDTLQQDLNLFPDNLARLSRTGSHGSAFNFYICAVRLRLTGPDGTPIMTPFVSSGVARCQ